MVPKVKIYNLKLFGLNIEIIRWVGISFKITIIGGK